MKPAVQPSTRPDGKPFETLDSLFRAVIAVPKSEIDKREKQSLRVQGKQKPEKRSGR